MLSNHLASIARLARSLPALIGVSGLALAQIPAHATQVTASLVDPRFDMMQAGDTVHAWTSDSIAGKGFYYRSDDGGRTWPVAHVEISDFALSSGARDGDRIVLAGSFDPGNANGGPGVVISNDGGQSWSPSAVLDTWGSFAAAATPRTAAHVVGNTITVVWTEPHAGRAWARTSLDGGLTWPNSQKRLLGQHPPPAFPQTMYLELEGDGLNLRAFWAQSTTNAQQANVWIGWQQTSTDGGLSWLSDPLAAPAPNFQSRNNVVTDASLQLCASYYTDYATLFESSNGGTSWSPIQLGAVEFDYVSDLDKDGATIAVAGRSSSSTVAELWTIAVSTDSGTTWNNPALQLPAPSPGYAADVQIVGDDLYVLFYREQSPLFGVLAHSNDGGVTWRAIEQDIGAFSAGKDRTVYAAFTDPTPVQPFNGYDVHAYVGHGWTPKGVGTPGTGGEVPTLTPRAAPLLGETVNFEIRNAVGGAIGLVAWSIAEPLATPFAGGTLWLQGPLATEAFVASGTPGVAGAGSATVPLTIPNVPAAIDASLTSQAATIDAAGGASLALTRAAEVWMR